MPRPGIPRKARRHRTRSGPIPAIVLRRQTTKNPGKPAANKMLWIGDSTPAEFTISTNRLSTPSGWLNVKPLSPLVEASQIPGSHQNAFADRTTIGIVQTAR